MYATAATRMTRVFLGCNVGGFQKSRLVIAHIQDALFASLHNT